MAGLYQIPCVDLRATSPVSLLHRFPSQAREIVNASTRTFGVASRVASLVAFKITDRASLSWLERADNPYLEEIHSFADYLKMDGVYTLNVCFEWGCTSGAFATPDGVTLRRVLDWRFPRLGEFIVVTLQQGPAGGFYNATWPGLSGVYQGMAPGRFAGAVNLAPMRRHGRGVIFDWLHNRVEMAKSKALPPAHLLRRIFEMASDFVTAKQMLCEEPIAVPAIFILTGMVEGEGCVIERTENDVAVRDMNGDRVCATNHFQSHLNEQGCGWLARPIDSHGRAKSALSMVPEHRDPFGWFIPPISNAHSRLVMNACANSNGISVMGTDGGRSVTETLTFFDPSPAQTVL